MSASREHYDRLLGGIYTWMLGDFDAMCARNLQHLRELGVAPGATRLAIDLGAGPGAHALPLVNLGFSVIAVDDSGVLVEELRARSRGLPVEAIEEDLVGFSRRFEGPADAVLCMGDTLTHLANPEAVETLLVRAAAILAPGGAFVTTFRDYVADPPESGKRFILVRSDSARILTCMLEYGAGTITVHDIVHERADAGWQMRVSSYPKLRLDPDWVAGKLSALGLEARKDAMPSGMLSIVARRRPAE